MFALEVEFLTGRAVASQRDNRELAEWPPHPGRLFSALVAAYAEGVFGQPERAALEWLEEQPPPSLHASEADPRQTVPVFVPVNDNSVPTRIPRNGYSASQLREGIKVLPERRSRQHRTFPSVTPLSSTVYFIWPDAEPGSHDAALQRVAAHVTYLGHSTSLVRIAVIADPPKPTFCPSEEGGIVLRVPTKGRLKQLEDAFRRQSRPSTGMYCGYERVHPEKTTAPRERDSVFGEAIVFSRENGQPVPLRAALHLTSTVRNALMDLAGQPSEMISGHQSNGAPSERPHVAIVPLASIDHFYADGSILGFAVVLPRELGRFDPRRHEIIRALAGLRQITSRRGEIRVVNWMIRRIAGDEERRTLRMAPYVGPARHWATVTPIVLDRYPKDKDGTDESTIIADACVNIGLPRPIRVESSIASPFRGVPPSGHFVGFEKGHPRRGHRVHAVLTFAEPIRGPVILGKNRYLGLGLLCVLRPRSGSAGDE